MGTTPLRLWSWRVVGAGLGVLLAGALPVSAWAATRPGVAMSKQVGAAALLNEALSAVKAERGLHYTSHAAEGNLSDTTEVQAAANSGLSTVVVREGALSGHLSAVCNGRTVYAKGDQHGLQTLNLTSKSAGQESGRWLTVTTTATSSTTFVDVYNELCATITVPSVVVGIELTTPKMVSAPKSVDGQKVLAIQGNSVAQSGPPPSVETVYVPATGKPLPVEVVLKGGSTSPTVTISFSDWGKAPAVHDPKGAVPFKAGWFNKTT